MLVAVPVVQITLINSGSLRTDMNAGTITFGDITGTLPFKNELTEMDLNGKDLHNLLEHGASLTNGILQVLKGAEIRYALQKPVSQRIVPPKANGEEIVDTNVHHVAITIFLTFGGGDFLAFREGKNIRVRAENSMSNIVIDYFREGHKITPAQVNEMRVEVSK